MHKKCGKCHEIKLLSEFRKDKSTSTGYMCYCKVCSMTILKANYEKNKEIILLKAKEYRENNKEKISTKNKEFYYANREKGKLKEKESRKKRAASIYFANATRKALKKRAIPSWADFEKIKQIYEHCKYMSNATGIKYSVDHIVPLKGKNVCGLHVEDNLQIIPLTDNISKRNSFTDDTISLSEQYQKSNKCSYFLNFPEKDLNGE